MSEIELHRKLLGDRVRNEAFAEALERTIRTGDTVADLGAGTGFLSFLARKLGAAHCHLYEYSEALALARELAQRNGITELTFVQAHSREVTRPPRADVVVSETFGNYALEEGLLETMIDARRFLKPGGVLIPARLDQFVAPVVTDRLQREIDVWPGIGFELDFEPAREIALNNMYVKTVPTTDLSGESAVRHWDEIEFAPAARKPPAGRRSGGAVWHAREIRSETVHGFALWWRAELVEGVALSTSPYAPPTHWQQVYLPLLQPARLAAGDELVLELTSDTRDGVRLTWETTVQTGGKARLRQRQDLARGRL